MDCSSARLLCPWDFHGKNAGAGCHFLLQGIFLTQESNLGLLYPFALAAGFLPLVPPGKPYEGIDLKQMDCQIFLNQWKFIWNQQKITIWGLQSWPATCKSQLGKGRKMLLLRGKGSWEGCIKQSFQGFLLAESLPVKNKSFFFLLNLIVFTGHESSPFWSPFSL